MTVDAPLGGETAHILEVIHQLENPRNLRTPGRAGELGPYQMKPATWRHLTTLPFTVENACDPELSRAVAVLHVEQIREALKGAGHPVTPAAIALCWSAGIGYGTKHGPLLAGDNGYVDRFSNLFYASDPRH